MKGLKQYSDNMVHYINYLILVDTPCRYAGDFRCEYNGYCIRAYDVCDGYEHCLDGSDEGMNC